MSDLTTPPERSGDTITADDVRAVARFLDQMFDAAVKRRTGVMLSWEDARGFALVLHAAADRLAAPPVVAPPLSDYRADGGGDGFPPTGLEPRGCPTPGACSCPPPRTEAWAIYNDGHFWEADSDREAALDNADEKARYNPEMGPFTVERVVIVRAGAAPPREAEGVSEAIECCSQCGWPKDRWWSEPGDETRLGWPMCETPRCAAFGERQASAWFRPWGEVLGEALAALRARDERTNKSDVICNCRGGDYCIHGGIQFAPASEGATPPEPASAAPKDETAKLVAFFNSPEGAALASEGDYNDWSPAETAIDAMKRLAHAEQAAREDRQKWIALVDLASQNATNAERERDAVRMAYNAVVEDGDVIERERDTAREALQFYADLSSYKSPSSGFVLQYDPEPSPIQKDHGKRARSVLESNSQKTSND